MTLLAALDFIKFTITDFIDIILVGIIIFELYSLLKGTAALRILWAITIIYIVWKLTTLFQLTLLSQILGQVISVGVIALIIVFQPEIRKFLLYFGNHKFIKIISGKFHKKVDADTYKQEINTVIRACRRMSNSKTGALIVFAGKTPLIDIIETGEKLDAILSRDLIENIFFKNSPLHDGAIIIDNQKIVAARCILPVAKGENIPTNLGLRHRAAIGATVLTDAVAVIVSEQTGQISLCKNGEITCDISPTVLEQMLTDALLFKN